MADPREARLPKWVQDTLSSLRRAVDVRDRVIAELKGQNPGSNTFLIDYGKEDAPLPKNARVGFHLNPDDGPVRRAIQVYVENGQLRVQGNYGLVIRMGASNSFTVDFEERYQ